MRDLHLRAERMLASPVGISAVVAGAALACAAAVWIDNLLGGPGWLLLAAVVAGGSPWVISLILQRAALIRGTSHLTGRLVACWGRMAELERTSVSSLGLGQLATLRAELSDLSADIRQHAACPEGPRPEVSRWLREHYPTLAGELGTALANGTPGQLWRIAADLGC